MSPPALLTPAGAAIHPDGKLNRNAYVQFIYKYADDEHCRERSPSSDAKPNTSPVEDHKGCGWIAEVPGEKKECWVSLGQWGFWRFALEMAKHHKLYQKSNTGARWLSMSWPDDCCASQRRRFSLRAVSH